MEVNKTDIIFFYIYIYINVCMYINISFFFLQSINDKETFFYKSWKPKIYFDKLPQTPNFSLLLLLMVLLPSLFPPF